MDKVREIALVTTGRADRDLIDVVVRGIASEGSGLVREQLYATGGHVNEMGDLSEDWKGLERTVTATVPSRSAHVPNTMGQMMARAVSGFERAIVRHKPDAMLVLGDRFETIAAAMAASSVGIPLIHMHGGELSSGAVDNQFRYAITALAHMHLVATELSRERLIAMGEPEDRVIRVGAPGIDVVKSIEGISRRAFVREVGLDSEDPFLLVTLHPTTLDPMPPEAHATILSDALIATGMRCLVTAANQDPGGDMINAVFSRVCESEGWLFVKALGRSLYPEAMRHAHAMVGNSSSGIIEAHSLGLPVINVGDRQHGRERNTGVVDVPFDKDAIAQAITDATSQTSRDRIEATPNIYGDGNTGGIVADLLMRMPLGGDILRKPFTPPALRGC